MTDTSATSEQTARVPTTVKTAAARNLTSAQRLAACYDQVVRTICQHGVRLPQLETLLLRREAPAEKPGHLNSADPGLEAVESFVASTNTPEPEAAECDGDVSRKQRAEREQFWLRREVHLQGRWRRVGAWTSLSPGWLARRQSVCAELVESRARALARANVDRRLIDAFLDEVIGYAQDLRLGADDWAVAEVEGRFDVSLPILRKVGALLAQTRDTIRHERSIMVQQNRSLVAGIARRFAGQGMLLEDLIQEGTLGLLRAIDKFDPARGFQFSTYAIWWIRQGVSRALLDQGRSVRVPVHLKEQTTRLRNVEARLAHRLGRTPTRAELGAEVGLSETKVQHLQQQLLADVSLQRPLYGDGEGELGDNLVDEHAQQPFVALEVERLGEHLSLALAQLDSRSRFVVTAHLGLDGRTPLTLDSISQQLGISRERVRQIEREALLRLRKSAQETHLTEYV